MGTVSKADSAAIKMIAEGVRVRELYGKTVRILCDESAMGISLPKLRFAIELKEDASSGYEKGIVLEISEGRGQLSGENSALIYDANIEVGTQIELGTTRFSDGVCLEGFTSSVMVGFASSDKLADNPFLEIMHSDRPPLEKLAMASDALRFTYVEKLDRGKIGHHERMNTPSRLHILEGISAAARRAIEEEAAAAKISAVLRADIGE